MGEQAADVIAEQRPTEASGRLAAAFGGFGALMMVVVGGGITLQVIWFCLTRADDREPWRAVVLVGLGLLCLALLAWSWRTASARYTSLRRVIEETCWRAGLWCLPVGVVALFVADTGL